MVGAFPNPQTVTASTNSCNSFQGQLLSFPSLYLFSSFSLAAFKVASKNLLEQVYPNQRITSLQRQIIIFLVADVSRFASKCTIGSSITTTIQISSNFFNQPKDTPNITIVFSKTLSMSTKKIVRFLWIAL